MAERFLSQAFNKLHSTVEKAADEYQQQQRDNQAKDDIGGEKGPEQAPDAIQRILRQWKNKEYFQMLGLPEPTVDELGRPVWSVPPADVSRAFRKLSVLVHPDKNSGEEARNAFESLNETHRILKDPSRLSELLKERADSLRRERERSEARSSVGERIMLNAQKNAKVKELRKEEGTKFTDTIVEQMKKRQEEARRKMETASKSRAMQLQKQDEDLKRSLGGSDSEDSDAELRRQAIKKRKKPTIMH